MNHAKEELKLDSPAAQRNKDPIWKVLNSDLQLFNPNTKTRVLEIAAGTGVHMQYFCRKIHREVSENTVEWFPADMDDAYLASIQVCVDELRKEGCETVHDPVRLSLDENGIQQPDTRDGFSKSSFDVILCINMIHIAPWSATVGLLRVAKELLKESPMDGRLVLYGPFFFASTTESPVPSNVQFDASLRSRNPAWGIRTLERVVDLAKDHGLQLMQPPIPMPANNHMVVFGPVLGTPES